jgi:hypothetical protein
MTDVPARREESERVGLARIVGTDAQPSAIARLTERPAYASSSATCAPELPGPDQQHFTGWQLLISS